MEFHISRSIRQQLKLDEVLFSYTGNVVFANVAASRKLAEGLNSLPGRTPNAVVNGGSLFAMGLIDELSHAMIARYRREVDPAVLTEAVRWFESRLGPAELSRLLLAFTDRFPNTAIFRGDLTPSQWLARSTEDLPNREAALEELLMLWLANINPAFKPFRELFDDQPLQQTTSYKPLTTGLPDYFVTRPPLSPEAGTLIQALQAPMLASPDSLTGQLEFIREKWTPYLGEDLKRVLLAIDVVREEDVAIWMRFHPGGNHPNPQGEMGWEAHGFHGDEYVGFEEDFIIGPDGVRRPRYASDHQAPLVEYEAFSADYAWMPTVVMMAKSTYVWLEQLSKKYQRHIHRLDQIPDEELKLLADRGMTALWLIGLWERSVASKTIKRLRGQADAVASAYSLKDYRIADDLGGNAAYESLRNRAAQFGLRLASDMVPNHMGIDSSWVIEHPEWFITRPDSPFPVYRFDGPDLSTDSRAEIKLEDHYYDQTDAAVAFRLRTHYDNTTRFMYHGNDGTTFAWNDTAQLDYSKAAVREQVMQTILYVARLFPIIRFDAAMVLAKRHVQRLWFPLPGVGGSIPSRAENAMSQEEFDALMPNEFWREVVDRVAVEVPGTLLLAEAFWLLEGYFVRTLGMHRVYNSAFMNMLRDEENAKYRSYLKKTVEFDPDILKRYVNFMSNPDERTAADQFGDGDKYFGTCTLLATLPGLPMFAHGQVEGFTERYGMDFKQARLQETPNEGFIARYNHEIVPLLRNRKLFAESTHFVLYDFWTGSGTVDENVIAYSNRLDGERAVILYNNRYGGTHGTIHISAASMDKGSGQFRQRSLTEALDLPAHDATFIAYRDVTRNLEYLRRSTDLRDHGLTLDLRGYQYVVIQQWRELRATADQPWDRLFDALHGEGVHSLDEALSTFQLRPVHDALRHVVNPPQIQVFIELAEASAQARARALAAAAAVAAAGPAPIPTSGLIAPQQTIRESILPIEAGEGLLVGFLNACQAFYAAAVEFSPSTTVPPDAEAAYRKRTHSLATAAVRLPALNPLATQRPSASEPPANPDTVHQHWVPILEWIALAALPEALAPATLFDRLKFRSALADVFRSFGIEGESSWRAAAHIRVLLAYPGTITDLLSADAFWSDPDVRWLAGVSEAYGTTFFAKEGFEQLLRWLVCRDSLLTPGAATPATDFAALAEKASYKLEDFRKLLKPAKPLPPTPKSPTKAPASAPIKSTKPLVTKKPTPPAKPAKPVKPAKPAKPVKPKQP